MGKMTQQLCVKMFGLFCQSVFICRIARNEFSCTIVLLYLFYKVKCFQYFYTCTISQFTSSMDPIFLVM